MTTAWERARCRDRLRARADSSLSSMELRLEAIGILKRTIGFDRWCWPAGVLHASFGLMLRPEFGALAMSASGITVVSNALLLRRTA